MFAKVSAQWHHLGETEPHWSVLTNESYFQDNFQMNRGAFYESGEAEIRAFASTLARVGVDCADMKRCLELGCGVGRVTVPLAKCFERVEAVDISSAHLHVAEEYVRSQQLTNVDFRHLDGIDGVAELGEFDLLYTRIVLQHNPPPVMLRLLSDLLSRLRIDGLAYIQLPTYKAGYRFRIDEYLQQKNVTDMEMHYLPQTALFGLLSRQGCRILEIREDDAIGISAITISNTLLVQKQG